MAAYDQLDREVAAFQLRSGLRCLTGCGSCCPHAPVQATVLEMLPAAHAILLRGQGDAWLERSTSRQTLGANCVLYNADAGPQSQGHCDFYTRRPMVCRLFGFAAVRDKKRQKKLAVCKILKKNSPGEAAAAIALEAEAPCFSEAAARIYGLKPDLGAGLLPINAALYQAIVHLGLRMQLGQSQSLGDTTAA